MADKTHTSRLASYKNAGLGTTVCFFLNHLCSTFEKVRVFSLLFFLISRIWVFVYWWIIYWPALFPFSVTFYDRDSKKNRLNTYLKFDDIIKF